MEGSSLKSQIMSSNHYVLNKYMMILLILIPLFHSFASDSGAQEVTNVFSKLLSADRISTQCRKREYKKWDGL
jgi:hypothetical protein